MENSYVASAPKKAKTHCTQFVVGGNRINYPGKVATPTAKMLVEKLLFNSMILTHSARFMTIDIANFYLMTPLKHPEYVKIKLRDIPEEIIVEYKLRDIATPDGNVYITATRATYTSKQLEACTGYHTQASLPTNNWKRV